MGTKRIRTIDLENPFPESLDGMCELLLVRHGERSSAATSRSARPWTLRYLNSESGRPLPLVNGSLR